MSFSSKLKTILRPCLINLVGVNSLRDCQDKFKCKSLINEDTSESCTVTEVNDENRTPQQIRMDNVESFRGRTRFYLEDLVDSYNSRTQYTNQGIIPIGWSQGNREFESTLEAIFHKYFGRLVHSGTVNKFGFSIAVSINGKLVLHKAFRYQDRENLVPAKEDMIQGIGSITKTLTCMMIMKLIEEEQESDRVPKITLDSCVQDILTPDIWPKHMVAGTLKRKKRTNTIRQLLRHSSGIRTNQVVFKSNADTSYTASEAFMNYEGNLKASIEKVKCKDLDKKPDDKSQYSNYAYQLLGLVYEKRTGRSFVEDLRDELAKMGLCDTDFDYKEGLDLDRARGYENGVFRDKKLLRTNLSWHEASYGLKSTVSDLVKFGNIMMNCLSNNRNPARHPIHQASMGQLFQNLKGSLANQITVSGFRSVHDVYQAHGWHYEVLQPLNRNIEHGYDELEPYRIMSISHSGGTTETIAQLSMILNESNRTVVGHNIKTKSLLYPLGEQGEGFKDDIAVGAILVERSGPLDVEKLLEDVMNILLCMYRHGCVDFAYDI